MPRARRSLHDLRIREVALCREGMNPGARMCLYKARDRTRLRKQTEEPPRSFEDHYQASRLMEIDEAIDRRLYALLNTTTEIIRSDVENREERILEAVDAYAETMQRDVPELFAGRLAKWLHEWAGESRPSREDVCAIVKSELGQAGLLPDEPSGGGIMEFLKSLSERGRAALAYVLGKSKPEEFFKDTSEEVGKLVVSLVEKAAEWGTKLEGLEADLAKARDTQPEPGSLEAILKCVSDEGVASFMKTQAAAIKKLGGDFADLQKANRRRELDTIAKSCEHLPNEKGSLTDALEKADEAGVLDPIVTALRAANEAAKLGKAFEEIGIETIPGQGGVSTPQEASEALLAKALELQKAKPELSEAEAFEKACEQNPTLYEQTRQRAAVAH